MLTGFMLLAQCFYGLTRGPSSCLGTATCAIACGCVGSYLAQFCKDRMTVRLAFAPLLVLHPGALRGTGDVSHGSSRPPVSSPGRAFGSREAEACILLPNMRGSNRRPHRLKADGTGADGAVPTNARLRASAQRPSAGPAAASQPTSRQRPRAQAPPAPQLRRCIRMNARCQTGEGEVR